MSRLIKPLVLRRLPENIEYNDYFRVVHRLSSIDQQDCIELFFEMLDFNGDGSLSAMELCNIIFTI